MVFPSWVESGGFSAFRLIEYLRASLRTIVRGDESEGDFLSSSLTPKGDKKRPKNAWIRIDGRC